MEAEPPKAERARLLSEIQTMQEGKETCYLVMPGKGSIEVTPKDDPSKAIARAADIIEEIWKIQVQYDPEGDIFPVTTPEERMSELQQKVDEMFKEILPAKIESIQQLNELINKHLDDDYARGYIEFLSLIPTDIPSKQRKDVIDPFLEYGESHGVPQAAEHYLRARKLNKRDINRLYSKDERKRRRHAGLFLEATGVSPVPGSITTLDELLKAADFSPHKKKYTVKMDYLLALPLPPYTPGLKTEDAVYPLNIIKSVVIPLLNRHGKNVKRVAKETLKRLGYKQNTKDK